MQKALTKTFYYISLILACNCFSRTWSLKTNLNLKICPEEETILNGTFKWKINYNTDVSYVISQPDVCWQNDSIILRQCDFNNGKWFPTQVQCKKFQSKNIKCSDDLIELFVNNEYLCLKISTKKQKFDEQFCYGSNFIIGYNTDIIEKEILMFILKKHKIISFWMPIKRYEENDLNPFVIRLPGKHWNELYEYVYEGIPLSVDKQTLGKHCISAYIQTEIGKKNQPASQLKMSNCNELHYSVCVIKKRFVAKSGCPQDFGALSHRPNECYGITWDGQKYPNDFRMLNVMEYFKKMNTINTILEEFDIVDDKYVEVEGIIEVPGGRWAIKPKHNQLKIVSSKEKIHGLCVEYIESRKNVEMVLRMDSDLESLVLTVYNKFYIWSNNKPEDSIHCFTNADYEELSKVELKKIWENDSQTKTIFKLNIKIDDPGQYWCEAHTIFNFTHVSSEKIISAKALKGHTFAMQTKASFEYQDFPFLFTPDQMKHLAIGIKENIKNIRKKHRHLEHLVIHNVRIMDIVYMNPNASYLRCLCHITISIKFAAVNTSNEQDNKIQDGEEVHDTLIRMRAKSLLINLINEFQPAFTNTVRSTQFCFPENEWVLAHIGQSVTKTKLCLQNNGLPVTRSCVGNFIEGAYWEELLLEDCIAITESHFITSNLYNIERATLTKYQEENMKDVGKILKINSKELIPADLYYLAKIIRNTVNGIRQVPSRLLAQHIETRDSDNFTDYFSGRPWNLQNLSEITREIVQIFDYLLEINHHVIRPTIALNATNILLDAFEYLMDYISSLKAIPTNTINTRNPSILLQGLINFDKTKFEIIEYSDLGVVVKMAKHFVIFIINPQVANITGIALYHAHSNGNGEFRDEGTPKGIFRNEYYRFILANQSINELLNEKSISMATFIPTSLWQRLDEISMMSNITMQAKRPEPKVVVKIYANDKLFQESNVPLNKIVVGKVISISIPGHDKELPDILPLILTIRDDFKRYNGSQNQKQYCRYWNYRAWAHDGVMLVNRSELNNSTVLCGCTHLTPFAYLIGGSYNLSYYSNVEVLVKEIHKQALDIITFLGCSLSLFGIAGIFVTACTFPSWRRKANSKVLLQLSAAIALQMILFCFVNTEENSRRLISNQIYNSCIAIGACLHYSVLVQFCWMIIIAYLQFKRYVQVFGNTRPKRFFVKSTIMGWGLPLIPVTCVLVFDSDSYIPQQNKSTNTLCYPSGIGFYVGIVLPITVVIVANLAIFIVVIYNILKNPAGAVRHTEKSLALSQIRVLVLLFFLLGFTWIFGLLNAMKAGLTFSYLFCLTATLQGFIIFVYFVVMDPVTRRLWYGYFVKIFGLKTDIEKCSSLKETTQSF